MVEAFKKNIAEVSILGSAISDEEFTSKVLEMIKACEENEALRRVESFQVGSALKAYFDIIDPPSTDLGGTEKR